MTSSTIPLSHPLYGASWPQAIARYFLKYATFSGRASRSEFWGWVLTNALVLLVFTTGRSRPAGARFDRYP